MRYALAAMGTRHQQFRDLVPGEVDSWWHPGQELHRPHQRIVHEAAQQNAVAASPGPG